MIKKKKKIFGIDGRIDTALLIVSAKATFIKNFEEKKKGALNGVF